MGNSVAENEAVDVLGLGHLLECSGQTVHQDTEGGGLWVCEVTQSGGVSFGLGYEITPVRHGWSGQRIGVSGVDQSIFEEDAARRVFAQRMFGANKAFR